MLRGLLNGAGPTPRVAWVRLGDRVAVNGATMPGVVVKIVKRSHGLHTVVVKWTSGSTGRHTISTLHRLAES